LAQAPTPGAEPDTGLGANIACGSVDDARAVIFTNGHTVDGDEVTVYCGAADTVTCRARMSISDILQILDARER